MGYQRTNDGREIVVMSPSTEGLKTWFFGAGDGDDRGGGTRIRLAWTAEEARGVKTVDIQFSEPVEVHDGQAVFSPAANWSPDDIVNLFAVLPATTTTPNGGGTGNCNRVPTGLGYDIIVPAAGNGAHDIVTPVPVPAEARDGHWECDYGTGVVTPSPLPGAAPYYMLGVELQVYFLRNMPLGHGTGVLDVDVYKTEWIHQNYKLRVSVDKQSAGAGVFAAWLLGFRKYNTL